MTSIRLFRRADLDAVLRIEQTSFGVDAWPRELFEQYAIHCPSLFLIARIGLRVAGYSIGCLRRDVAEIESIAVSPRHRGQRIGAMLLSATIRKVQRSGARTVMLMVRRDNIPAIALYRGFGFVRAATVNNYYEDGATAWRMRLEL